MADRLRVTLWPRKPDIDNCRHYTLHELWGFPLGESLVAARPDIQGLFLLNPSARFIWEAVRSGTSSHKVSQDLSNFYGIPLSWAERDVGLALGQWSGTLLAAERPIPPPFSTIPFPQLFFPSHSGDYQLNGIRFRIQVGGDDLSAEIVPRLEPLRSQPATPDFTLSLLHRDNSALVFREQECIAAEELTSGARAVLLQEITRLAEPGREWRAILHAGACGTGGSRLDSAILLAGSSHSGKTTLCAALMASGLTFYSDDSAALDQRFQVAAMPFALMLREGSWPLLLSRFPELQNAPIFARWGANVRFLPPRVSSNSSPTVPVKALLFVSYQPGSPTNLKPLPTFEALLALQQSGFWVPHTREAIARFLDWLTTLPLYQLTYSDLDQAIATIRQLLA